jgi:hypothetical protein
MVQWSRPRVEILCLSFHFLHLLPSLSSSLKNILTSLAVISVIGSVHQKAQAVINIKYAKDEI